MDDWLHLMEVQVLLLTIGSSPKIELLSDINCPRLGNYIPELELCYVYIVAMKKGDSR